MKESYQIIRSNRRTLGLQVLASGELLVRAPRRASRAEIEAMVEKHRGWIEKARARAAATAPAPEQRLTAEELEALGDRLLALLPERLAHFAPLVGVDYGRVTVRSQKTLWGSCSAQGNLSFNCLLALAPGEVLDYIVVHELCHRRQMNHSPAFWAEVERVLPGYRAQEAWLKSEGRALLRRMTG